MWIFTELGFYSAVTDFDDDNVIWVRGRDRGDMERLVELVERERADRPELLELADADYRYRVRLNRDTWSDVLSRFGRDARYHNFKDAVAERDPDRAHLYMDVWSTLRTLQSSRDAPAG